MLLTDPVPHAALQIARVTGLLAMAALIAPRVWPGLGRLVPRHAGALPLAAYALVFVVGLLWLLLR